MAHREHGPDPSISLSWDPAIVPSLADAPDLVRSPGYLGALADNATEWAHAISAGRFWRSVKAQLPIWTDEYCNRHGGTELVDGPLSNFCAKSASSIQDKIRRATKPPLESSRSKPMEIFKDGSLVPSINDLVRCRVACTYLDGATFLADKLCDFIETEKGERTKPSFQNRIEGYYAIHVYFHDDVILQYGQVRHPIQRIKVEIQIATVLATQAWKATHAFYEMARGTGPDRALWSPETITFIARQLGHMVHLADGLIVQLKNHVRAQDKD